MPKTFITISEQQTIELAKKFARKLTTGLCLGLVGNLGMGKTQFVKGLALGLGVGNTITSPTFVLLKEYQINKRQDAINKNQGNTNSKIKNLKSAIKNFIHIDCYRLSSPKELLELGLEEYLKDPQTVVAIEWADKIKEILPKETVWIEFEQDKNNIKKRKIAINLLAG
jgi:tRNA threonylcarbamoyladenosine biosynthesis protein TsaE